MSTSYAYITNPNQIRPSYLRPPHTPSNTLFDMLSYLTLSPLIHRIMTTGMRGLLPSPLPSLSITTSVLDQRSVAGSHKTSDNFDLDSGSALNHSLDGVSQFGGSQYGDSSQSSLAGGSLVSMGSRGEPRDRLGTGMSVVSSSHSRMSSRHSMPSRGSYTGSARATSSSSYTKGIKKPAGLR